MTLRDKTATDLIVRILQTENGQLLIEMPQRHDGWWKDPSAWSPFVALLIAVVGWYLSSKNLNRQLAAERLQKRQEFQVQERRKRAELVREKLNSFYRPYRQLSDTNKLLHQALKDRQANPAAFRTLVSLLEGHDFSQDDKGLIREIVHIGSQLERLLATKSGFVEDDELRNMFAVAAEHFRILRMAFEGKLKGDSKRFAGNVYPRDLDHMLNRCIDALQRELETLETSLRPS